MGPELNAGKFQNHISAFAHYHLCSVTLTLTFMPFVDTWALFGSIAWQIANNKITGVNDDGTFNAV